MYESEITSNVPSVVCNMYTFYILIHYMYYTKKYARCSFVRPYTTWYLVIVNRPFKR